MIHRRPLRFLALTLGGWTALRVVMLLPEAVVPVAIAKAPATLPAVSRAVARPALAIAPAVLVPPPTPLTSLVRHAATSPSPAVLPIETISIAAAAPTVGAIGERAAIAPPSTPAPAPFAAAPSRWSGSAWAIARGGSATPFAPQLGGSQAGARLAFAVGGGIALAGRVSGALGQRQREAAFGVEWRPFAAPVRLVAEQRVALDGGRGGPALGLVGGVDRVPLAGGVTLTGYGQTGGIARGGIEGFADGAMRASRDLVRRGALSIDLGAASWGAAQRGAARLDLGPTLGLTLPIGDRRLRAALDWRMRVAGNAGPTTGPALSVGTDF